MSIREQKEALNKIISDAYKMLADLRQQCPHEHGIYEYHSESEGWDNYASFWKSMSCTDCGKNWLEDSKTTEGQRNDAYYTNPSEKWVGK